MLSSLLRKEACDQQWDINRLRMMMERGTDSLNVLDKGERGAPAASDVSIIPRGSGTAIRVSTESEREARCRAIDRPADHAHPGERGALMLQVKIERQPGQTRPAQLLHQGYPNHSCISYLPVSS
ncbi:jg16970 [Pararge aegeria aegeria]|uniref:Jg16970 protein n=1 Tax=Pararge aegeria aegeria TaxID=348720 RepID=A0A8S4RHB6_9NEOP|nr:jg16970 [Pararge aegeria aegeria]